MKVFIILFIVYLLGAGIGYICTIKYAEERARRMADALYAMHLDHLAEIVRELDIEREVTNDNDI